MPQQSQSPLPPSKQRVKYVGSKSRIAVQFPVPYVAKSEADGDPVWFTQHQPVELSIERASQLVKTSPALFKMVE